MVTNLVARWASFNQYMLQWNPFLYGFQSSMVESLENDTVIRKNNLTNTCLN